MIVLYQVCKVLSVAVFLYYGIAVIVSNAMVAEFERFGLLRLRKLTGLLELLGALGLILGYFVPHLTVAAAGGLTVLMAAGIVVRIRCRDSLVDALPATVMMLVNLYIVIYALGIIPTR